MAPSVHQYIRISGQAHERGVAYGSFAKERILKVIDEYKVLFDKEARICHGKMRSGWQNATNRQSGLTGRT